MAASPTVLDWHDIKVLIELCSNSLHSDQAPYRRLESARHCLVESLQLFIQEWHPGRMMDNKYRHPLVQALDEYSEAWDDVRLIEGQQPSEELPRWASIKQRLERAIADADATENSSSNGMDGMLTVLLLVALQQIR